MGHARLKTLPDTRPWRRVVGHVAGGAAAAAVAQATTQAAARALADAGRDPGVARVVFLLARIVLAARQTHFAAALEHLLIRVPDPPALPDLTAGVSQALQDWYAAARHARTDFADLAELAANEALTRCLGDRGATLFPGGDEVRAAARELSTPRGFSALAHEFFARFAQRFLHYHLDRELSHHVGGNGRFPDRAARRAFADDLEVHCREAAEIVRRYARDWFSKARFEQGVTEAQARAFARVCMKKLRAELLVRGEAGRV
jgi:hypothetical protein